MADCMAFPEKIEDYINFYKFTDTKQYYTNGSELIQVFRVQQMFEHYMPKWILVSEPPKEYRDKYGELIPFLVCGKDTEYPYRALYDGKTWGDGLCSVYPTHWMPLPALPKECE